VLALKPDDGIIGEIKDEGVGGFMARRLLPAAIGIPIIIGWITTEGESLGLYGNQFGEVIAATAYIAIAFVLTWRIARSLNKLDGKRKRVEKEMRESEKHFKELFDDAPVAYHELDLEGRIVRVNQTELWSLGYRVEEMLGHFVWEFLDDQEASRQAVLAKLSGSLPAAKGVERLYRRKDLTTITVVIEDKLLRDADGRITGIRTTLQDITELKRAVRLNAALYEISQAVHSIDNLDGLYRHIHLALSNIIPANNFFIALLTNDGKTLHFPYERDEKDTGDWKDIEADDSQSLTVEVLRSKRPLLLDEKDLLDRYSSSKNRVWGTAPKCWLGVPLMTKENAIGVMAVQDYHRGDVYGQKDVAPFESAAGQIAIAIERKRAEKAVIASELKLRRVWESTFDGMRVVDGEGTILMVNEAYCTMIGKGREELVGKPFSIFTVESLQRQTLEKHKQRFSSGTIAPRAEKELVLWNERRVWFEVSSSFLEIKGHPKGVLSIFRDVTDRKLAEERLKESEERFRLAIHATKDGLWEWDIQTNQEFFSPRWCEIIGYSFDDPELLHTYESWASRIHPDDYDRVVSAMNNHLEKGTKYDVDYRHRHKSGEYRWQNSMGRAVFDESGKPTKMVGCIRDINERKRAEDVLKDSESSLRYAQEIAKMGSWEWNMVTQETNWSDSYFAIHGFKPTEVEPSFELFRNRIHPEDVHLLDKTHANIMKARTPASFELRIIQPDGTVKWIQNNIAPVIEDDKLVGLKGVIIDVTERKLAEQERESLIEELKTALENVRTLDGLVPICAHCKKIRDDKGYWNQLEKYIVDHTDANLTHGLCPDCAELYFPGLVPKT
jgi:PAS domain S-box-containing protein